MIPDGYVTVVEDKRVVVSNPGISGVTVVPSPASPTHTNVGIPGPPGPEGPSGPALDSKAVLDASVRFTHSDNTVVLASVPGGSKIWSSSVRFTAYFNDPYARVSIGTDDDPELVLSKDDNVPTFNDTFEVDTDLEISSPCVIKLFVHGNVGDQGAGVASIKYSKE